MLLDVQHISKSFTTGYIRKVKKEVLKDISFTLSKGETLGIAGTSGAGKTTLIRILMQLLRPDGGVVLYHGLDLGELSGKEMLAARRVGILSAGRLVEIGAAEDVLHHPQHPYTQELVSSFSAL